MFPPASSTKAPGVVYVNESQETTAALLTTLTYLRDRLTPNLAKPRLAIVCGSGLGGLADIIEDRVEFEYADIPGFVVSTVLGHEGRLVFGLLGKNNTPTVCMIGRFHFYEGHSLKQTTFPVRVFHQLGVKMLIVTNAVGSLNKNFCVGDIAVLADHVNLPGLAGNNPLFGPNLADFGPRFPAMLGAYDFQLREIAFRAAASINLPAGTLKEGTYCFVAGPSYETPAEARFLQSLGDVVGMSTVPEVVVARHCGLRVLGLSLVTNTVAMGRGRSADPAATECGIDEEPARHEEVLAVSQMRAREMQALVAKIIDLIENEGRQ